MRIVKLIDEGVKGGAFKSKLLMPFKNESIVASSDGVLLSLGASLLPVDKESNDNIPVEETVVKKILFECIGVQY